MIKNKSLFLKDSPTKEKYIFIFNNKWLTDWIVQQSQPSLTNTNPVLAGKYV